MTGDGDLERTTPMRVAPLVTVPLGWGVVLMRPPGPWLTSTRPMGYAEAVQEADSYGLNSAGRPRAVVCELRPLPATASQSAGMRDTTELPQITEDLGLHDSRGG